MIPNRRGDGRDGTEVTREAKLEGDALTGQFAVDDAGNIVVKNKQLAEVLKTAMPDAGQNVIVSINAVIDIN